MNMPFGRDCRRNKTLRVIDEAAWKFEDAVRVSELASGTPDAAATSLVVKVRQELSELKTRAEQATRAAEFESIQQRARELAQFRGYVLPTSVLPTEGRRIVAHLRDWRLPREAQIDIDALVEDLMKDNDKPDAKAPSPLMSSSRKALVRLMHEYDYWDSYIHWYFRQIHLVAAVLLALVVTGLIASYVLLWNGSLVWGFLLAAMAGVSASIVLRLPGPSVYGDTASLWGRLLARYAVGLTGAILGLGLLYLGTVQIAGLEEILPGRPGAAADGLSQKAIVILMSLGILFGFSERFLLPFEDMIFRRERPRAAL